MRVVLNQVNYNYFYLPNLCKIDKPNYDYYNNMCLYKECKSVLCYLVTMTKMQHTIQL